MQVFENFISRLEESNIFTSVKQAEMGKISVGKAPAAIVLFDVAPPKQIDETEVDQGKIKKATLVADVFIFTGKHSKQYLSDNEGITLGLRTINVITDIEQPEELVEINNGAEYGFWEFTNWEFVERSASGSVLNVEFRMEVYL